MTNKKIHDAIKCINKWAIGKDAPDKVVEAMTIIENLSTSNLKWKRKRNGNLVCGDFVIARTMVDTYGIWDDWGVIDDLEFKSEDAAIKWVERKIGKDFR